MTGRLVLDERGFILSSVVRFLVFLAVFALAGIETASVVFARVQTQDTAESAAFEAAGNYRQNGDVEAAREAAQLRIVERDPGAELRQFEVRTDGSVRVVVFKRVHTLVIHRIGFLEEFTKARGKAVAQPPPA